MKYHSIVALLSMITLIGCAEFETTEPPTIASGDIAVALEKKGCPKKVHYEGKFYSTIQVGDQCWLYENLNVGTMVSGSSPQSDDNHVEKYCYNDDPENCEIYGGLYQWNEAMKYQMVEGAQGICPRDWRLPTSVEIETLSNFVENDGNSLKSIGQGQGIGAGTNTSGFSALFAGFKNYYGSFSFQGASTGFWSSTESDFETAIYMALLSDTPDIIRYPADKSLGWSVRCIWDR